MIPAVVAALGADVTFSRTTDADGTTTVTSPLITASMVRSGVG
jgi:hypothetical protein